MFFFFNDTATTEIYTLSLHDALPIFILRTAWESRYESISFEGKPASPRTARPRSDRVRTPIGREADHVRPVCVLKRSEEHTSELQSRQYLVCRLLLEKKKKQTVIILY